MSLHNVMCDPCCWEAITHWEGSDNAATREWRASRLGCRDEVKAVKVLRGRETTRLEGWMSATCRGIDTVI